MPLDEYQELVVNSTDKKILCLAGAGAGKSHSLLSRIYRLIDDGVLPSQILVLTFTNAAAAEMRERFRNARMGAISPEFRTFHSFSYSLICRDYTVRTALGYDKVPNIASEEFEKEIYERARLQCKITVSTDKLKSRQGLTRDEKRQVMLYDKAVSRLMKREEQITFDILNREVSALFVNNDPCIYKYKTQYKYIAIDEFQDTDAEQASFVFSFTDSNLFCCGDALQNIYSWRGTDNKFIKQLAKSDDWKKIKLLENYRSTRQICEYANRFSATYADEAYRIKMHSDREGDEVIERKIDYPDNYDAIDSDTVRTILKDLDGLSGTSAILCRTNREVSEVCDYLKLYNVDYVSRKETKAAKLIECALSDEYMLGYLASLLNANKYGEYLRLSSQHPNDIKWFLDTYGSNKDISSDSKKIMILRELSTLLLPMDKKLKEVEKVLRLKTIPIPESELFGIEFLKWLKDSVSEVKSNELYVGTIHSVKGLEYDNVCVANVGAYCFQLDSEEMNNLFYVAVTRAKNRLFIYRV